MLARDEKRSTSPQFLKLQQIDHKYGGKPKKDQMVREGHCPKISELIDMVEKIAVGFVNFENYI